MRIVLLSPEFPLPTRNATRQRTYQLLRGLAGRHEIHLLTFHSPDEAPSPSELREVRSIGCRSVASFPWHTEPCWQDLVFSSLDPRPHAYRKFRSSSFRRALQEIVRTQAIDLVQCDINMTEMRRYSGELIASVVSPCDSFTKLMARSIRFVPGVSRKLYTLLQLMKFYRAEYSLYPTYTKCHVVSSPEAAYLRHLNPRIDTAIVPIGADVPREFPTEAARAPQPGIVFSGQMSNPFTVDGVVWFYRNVWPLIKAQLPGCQFWLVGSSPARQIAELAKRDTSVVVTGFVENIVYTMQRQLVYVCPLLYGAGVKTRLLEAMASGMPVVVTTIGAEGIDLVHREHALVADRPVEFAGAVVELFQSPALRGQIAKASYELIRSRYTWDAYARGMEQMYVEAVNKHRARRALRKGAP